VGKGAAKEVSKGAEGTEVAYIDIGSVGHLSIQLTASAETCDEILENNSEFPHYALRRANATLHKCHSRKRG